MRLRKSIGWTIHTSRKRCHSLSAALASPKFVVERRMMASPCSSSRLHSSPSPSNQRDSDSNNRPLVVIIAGSTGVGKSDVAALLCQRQQGIIVSADSVQAYRHVQIGANKPTPEELQQTPHLLIDVADSSDSYNAAEWMEDAMYVIQKLQQQDVSKEIDLEDATRRRRPIIDQAIQDAKSIKKYESNVPITPVIVGGTMMYIQWLVHGRPDAPSPTAAALDKAQTVIQTYETDQDWTGAVTHAASLHTSLKAPVEKLFANDWYRLRRILEVAYTVQEQIQGQDSLGKIDLGKCYSGERAGGLLSLNYDVRCFFLCPHDRMMHSRAVDERCESMLMRGLVQETCNLALSRQLPDMAAKAIGYRQVLDYLGREGAKDNDYDAFLQFLEEFTTATRQYSRRQVQWFKKDEHFVFASVDLTREKSVRVHEAAAEIERMIGLSREDFDAERLADESHSAETRRKHEEQAKGMRTYIFHHHCLKPGSSELEAVLKEADECTHRYQAKRVQPLRVEA